MLVQYRPMPLVRVAEPFDDSDWLYELKLDGFRALAFVENGRCRLVSRNGHRFNHWPALCDAIPRSVDAPSAVLDGEIVCIDHRGKPHFRNLLFRRREPHFFAFDVIAAHGNDLRLLPLIDRKHRLFTLLRNAGERVRYVDFVHERGCDLFAETRRRDLEGVVAKWSNGTYQSGGATSWLKIKNPTYSQMVERYELFTTRRSPDRRSRSWAPPVLVLA